MTDTSAPQSKSFMQRFGGALRMLIGLSLAAWIVYTYRADFLTLRASEISWGLFALGMFMCLATTLLTFVRWYVLVRATGLPFTLRDAVVIGAIGYAFNFLLPGAVGGDLVKAVMMAKRQERRGVAITTIAMDRIIGVVALVIVAGLAGAWWLHADGQDPRIREIAVYVLWALPLALVGVIAMLSRPICENPLTRWMREWRFVGPIVTAVLEAFAAYRARPGVVIGAIAMGIVSHLILIGAFWCLSESLVAGGSPLQLHLLLAPLGLIGGALPLTPGGLGVLEFAMAKMYEYGGLAGGTAAKMVLAYRMAQVVIALGGLVIYRLYGASLTSVTESETTQ